MKSNDAFWVFTIASVGISVYAWATLSEPAFYAAAVLAGAAMVAFMFDSGDDE
jgi:hypothetical protein